jgi:hypothetical protein
MTLRREVITLKPGAIGVAGIENHRWFLPSLSTCLVVRCPVDKALPVVLRIAAATADIIRAGVARETAVGSSRDA